MNMIVYKVVCEFEMPLANGYFSTMEKAQAAIDNEKWSDYTGYTLQEMKDLQYVTIEEIEIK